MAEQTEQLDETIQLLSDLLQSGQDSEFIESFEALHDFEMAQVYAELPEQFRAVAWRLLPTDVLAAVFDNLDVDEVDIAGLLAEMPPQRGAQILQEMYTDNAHSHKPWEGPYELVQTNGITAGNDFGYGYSTVRIANNFIINVDKCDISEGLKERMKAEARFFRAWQYLQLTTKFGKAYLFTDVPEYNAPYAKRDPAEKVQAFILSELNEIAEILPDEYDGSYLYESSRITRAAALALRARAALYFGNYIEAEASAGKVISEGHHSLFRVTSLNAAQQQEADEIYNGRIARWNDGVVVLIECMIY